jgi:hypothetical protein
VQLSAINDRTGVISGYMTGGILSSDLKVCYENLIFLRAFRLKRGWLWRQHRLARDREDAEVELGIDQPAWLVGGDVDSELLEEPKDRAGLYGSRRIMVAGDENDGRVRQGFAEPLELPKRKDDGVVRRTDGMKQIARDDHRIGPGGYHAVDGVSECLSDVCFPLIEASRSLPVVLPDSEVRIGDMGQFHGWRMGLNAVKSKHL